MSDTAAVIIVMGVLNVITSAHSYMRGWDEGEHAQLMDDVEVIDDYRAEIEELERALQLAHDTNKRLIEANAALRSDRKHKAIVIRETYRLAQKLKADKSELEKQLESFVNAYDRTNSDKES